DAALMSFGVQHQRERGALDSVIDFGAFQVPAAFALRRATSSVFAEARWQSEGWGLQGGVRGERADGDGAGKDVSSTHPMLSLQHTGGNGLQWGASVSRASKLPSFYALGQPLVGNPLLQPETATHRELYFANAPEAAWA